MKYDLKNRIANIDHRFYLHNAKVQEGEKTLEDGTKISGGGYYIFAYEDSHQRIQVQIDKEIKAYKKRQRYLQGYSTRLAGIHAKNSKPTSPARTLIGK